MFIAKQPAAARPANRLYTVMNDTPSPRDDADAPVFAFNTRISLSFIAIIAACILCGVFIYGVSDILLPFIVGVIAAYFLDPVADKIEEKWDISRTNATLAVCAAFFAVITALAVFLVPQVIAQGADFIDRLPALIEKIKREIVPQFQNITDKLDAVGEQLSGKGGKVTEAADKAQNAAFGFLPKVIKGVFLSGMALLNLTALIFITPIVTFYMLKDWDTIVASSRELLPPRWRPEVVSVMRDIDGILAGYIRGQTNVCLLLGFFYAVALWAAGLDYGIFIGMMTGILCFLPYVGIAVGATVGMIIAFMQFSGDWLHIGLIGGIFIIGQFAEGNFITPKLVGDKVQLHPAWIIFALLAGGSLFGFIGILLAVPVAAVTGVLARRAKKAYCRSDFYGGDAEICEKGGC